MISLKAFIKTLATNSYQVELIYDLVIGLDGFNKRFEFKDGYYYPNSVLWLLWVGETVAEMGFVVNENVLAGLYGTLLASHEELVVIAYDLISKVLPVEAWMNEYRCLVHIQGLYTDLIEAFSLSPVALVQIDVPDAQDAFELLINPYLLTVRNLREVVDLLLRAKAYMETSPASLSNG